jgi:hypothetical protein
MWWALSTGSVAIVVVLCFAAHLRHKLKLLHDRDANNTKFLLAETKTEAEKSKHALEIAQVEARKNEEASLLALLEGLNRGHSPDCSYCSCGHSKMVEGLKVTRNARLELEREFRDRMLADGWEAPEEPRNGLTRRVT